MFECHTIVVFFFFQGYVGTRESEGSQEIVVRKHPDIVTIRYFSFIRVINPYDAGVYVVDDYRIRREE